jgi:hypothetical protein
VVFVAGIERAMAFTRPIHTIVRYFGAPKIVPGAATLFFVNQEGWALTCRHVAEQVIAAEQLAAKYAAFRTERASIKAGNKAKQEHKALQRKYGFDPGVPVEVFNNFVNCVEGPIHADVKLHPQLDVALLRFQNYTKLHCTTFPVFALPDVDLKPGMLLCRLGFPFPEFTNFEYDAASDAARWTQVGRIDTPVFPIDGMVTRHLVDQAAAVVGFEMSTPGLRGQSGGPAFGADGRVWGMQASTNHLDLDFDVDLDVTRNGAVRTIKHHAVLHVGHCIHLSALKAFMRLHNVTFAEAPPDAA